MKAFILILTFLFASSVLADCCNYDIGFDEVVEKVVHESHDDCQDVQTDHQHNDMDHCGCTHTNHHLRIHKVVSTAETLSVYFYQKSPPSLNLLKLSDFKFSIFHPPRA